MIIGDRSSFCPVRSLHNKRFMSQASRMRKFVIKKIRFPLRSQMHQSDFVFGLVCCRVRSYYHHSLQNLVPGISCSCFSAVVRSLPRKPLIQMSIHSCSCYTGVRLGNLSQLQNYKYYMETVYFFKVSNTVNSNSQKENGAMSGLRAKSSGW